MNFLEQLSLKDKFDKLADHLNSLPLKISHLKDAVAVVELIAHLYQEIQKLEAKVRELEAKIPAE